MSKHTEPVYRTRKVMSPDGKRKEYRLTRDGQRLCTLWVARFPARDTVTSGNKEFDVELRKVVVSKAYLVGEWLRVGIAYAVLKDVMGADMARRGAEVFADVVLSKRPVKWVMTKSRVLAEMIEANAHVNGPPNPSCTSACKCHDRAVSGA